MDEIDKHKVIDEIHNYIKVYQEHPFDYLYEADIQSALFARLFDLFKDDRIEIKGGYKGNDGQYGKLDDIKSISTNIVKREYPTGSRFDIALIDHENPFHWEKYKKNHPATKNDSFWRQPLCMAIEIKLFQLGQVNINGKIKKGLENEYEKYIKKLIEYSKHHDDFLGMSLCFVQPYKIKPDWLKDKLLSFIKTSNILGYIICPDSDSIRISNI